jgi:hypothetical protein
LGVKVDNERQEQQQDFKRKPWLWRGGGGGGEEEEEGRGTKVSFLCRVCTIVACQVPEKKKKKAGEQR